MSQASAVTVRILDGFEDTAIDERTWRRIQQSGPTNEVFLTYWWQKTWWNTFGRGELIIIGVYEEGELIGLAPLFSDGGMIFFVGSGGSDYLDFVGKLSTPHVLAELLAVASEASSGFVGFRFYHVPDNSPTGGALQLAAQLLGYECFDEGELVAPIVDLKQTGDKVTKKKSLLRHQRYFEREGSLVVRHFLSCSDIQPRLESFFKQHIDRWNDTPYPSLFLDENQRMFYRALIKKNAAQEWLRFTELCWNDSPVAYHFGFHFNNHYLWYKPTFAVDLWKRSPGEVLLRNLLIAALDEGARFFDFGLGDETFKSRFATGERVVRTWGLYPRGGVDAKIAT